MTIKKRAFLVVFAFGLALSAVFVATQIFGKVLVLVQTDSTFPGGELTTDSGRSFYLKNGHYRRLYLFKNTSEANFVLKCRSNPETIYNFGYIVGNHYQYFDIDIHNCKPTVLTSKFLL